MVKKFKDKYGMPIFKGLYFNTKPLRIVESLGVCAQVYAHAIWIGFYFTGRFENDYAVFETNADTKLLLTAKEVKKLKLTEMAGADAKARSLRREADFIKSKLEQLAESKT